MSIADRRAVPVPGRARLPLAGLLALFTAGFLGILNETLPAGLLPEMAQDLHRSESAAGQTITVYALATALTAIPLGVLLRARGRRVVLVSALVAFAAANAVAALSGSFPVLLVTRFVAGVGAGLVWSNIGGYAARLVPEGSRGAAVTLAMAGTPVALALGLPAGTLLGNALGWQATFGVVAVASAGLIGWVLLALPELPGTAQRDHVPTAGVLRSPGVRPVLGVVAGFMVAHTVLYTYIGPLAEEAGGRVEWVLLVFGVAALLSIWATGSSVDPHHRRLTVASTLLVGAGALVLGLAVVSPVALYLGVAVWGAGFGGSATLFLTAAMRAAGTDAVQSIVVTVFNVSIAAGGLAGGLLLAGAGIRSVPWVAVAIMVPTVLGTVAGRRHAFPRWS